MLIRFINWLLALVFLFFTIEGSAQYSKRLWHVYAAPSVGLMYYTGELKRNSLPEDEYIHMTAGLQVALQYDQLFTMQVSYTRGGMSGYDSLVNESLENRAYEFTSKTNDIEVLLKLSLMNTKKRMTQASKPVFHPRLMAGFGLINFNPQAEYRGEMINLQQLGTEGQYINNGSYPSPYSLWAFGIKLGAEANIQTGPRTGLNFYGYYTFAQTDYLDDVGGGKHIDLADLSLAENPEMLAEFAYARSLDTDITTTPAHTRGNPDTNDGYFNFGFSINYRLTGASSSGYRSKF